MPNTKEKEIKYPPEIVWLMLPFRLVRRGRRDAAASKAYTLEHHAGTDAMGQQTWVEIRYGFTVLEQATEAMKRALIEFIEEREALEEQDGESDAGAANGAEPSGPPVSGDAG